MPQVGRGARTPTTRRPYRCLSPDRKLSRRERFEAAGQSLAHTGKAGEVSLWRDPAKATASAWRLPI